MGETTDNNRQLSDDLDKLITGEQTEINDVSEEDYDKTLMFAKRMLDSRVEPSPAFKDGLRKRLLSKMIEKEMETERKRVGIRAFWGTIISLMPHTKTWRTITVTIAVFAIALVVSWRMGVFTDTTTPPLVGLPPPSSTIPQGPVEVTATPSQDNYVIGEVINIEFIFSNETEGTLILKTFPPKLIIAAASLRPYKTIPSGESKALEPGETIEYTMIWDQIDDNGQQVPPGTYVINMLDIELENDKGIVTLPESPRIVIVSP